MASGAAVTGQRSTVDHSSTHAHVLVRFASGAVRVMHAHARKACGEMTRVRENGSLPLAEWSAASCRPLFIVITFVSTTRVMPTVHGNLLLRSAADHRYPLVMLQWNRSNNYLQKVTGLRDLIRAECNESIVLLTDAHDTFLAAPVERTLAVFRQLGSGIVFSTEKMYTWGEPGDKTYYDAHGRGEYRYLNGGGLMGYVGALRRLLEQVIFVRFFKGADQVAYSHLIAQRGKRAFDVALDFDSRLFYVASGSDWDYAR